MSAFNFNGSSGVRAPWVFGYLYSGALFGLACADGDYTPGTAYWDERPRLALNKVPVGIQTTQNPP